MDANTRITDGGFVNFSPWDFFEKLAELRAKQEYGTDYKVTRHTVSARAEAKMPA